MSVLPHDLTDLFLAPTLLDLDDRLETMGALNPGALAFEIILATNQEPRDVSERPGVFLDALRAGLDLHGWELELTGRGARLSHDGRCVTLGLPANVRDYLAG